MDASLLYLKEHRKLSYISISKINFSISLFSTILEGQQNHNCSLEKIYKIHSSFL